MKARWLAVWTLLMPALAHAAPPLRVACVGDSITYGDQLTDRDTQAYPVVLQRLAPERYLTGNFGVNGATALHNSYLAWTDTPACRAAQDFAPDIVVIMLGINDLSYPDHAASYADDLLALTRLWQAQPIPPRLFLCTLTPLAPAFLQGKANRTIRNVMNPAIRTVAAQAGAGVIDISANFPNRLALLPDGVHPSAQGAELIARTVLAALDAATAPPPQIQPAPEAGPVAISVRNEALAARDRAAQWLAANPAPPSADAEPAADPAPLLPLLVAPLADAPPGLYSSLAALAAALAEAGQRIVFITDDQPVAWREALLHQLVQRQKIATDGTGYWTDTESDAISAATRAPQYALRALALALGE